MHIYLSVIELPFTCVNCTNLLCTNTIRVNTIQLLHYHIIFALLKLSEIIHETGTVTRNMPGWNGCIKHFKCIASFWR